MQMRNDDAYKSVYDKTLMVANDNNISVSLPPPEALQKRPRTLPKHLANSVVMSTIGKRDRQPNSVDLKRNMFEMLDKMDGEIDRRFSGNESLLRGMLYD